MNFTLRAVLALLAVLCLTSGCTTIARVSNLTDMACQSTFSKAVSAILVEQGEKPEVVGTLADHAVRIMLRADYGPRPFFVASPSGTDYTFFVQAKKPVCLLRLYGRQKGFWSYTNNLTYIATRPLPGCFCSE